MKTPNNINRTGLVVEAKQPFFDWALSIVDKLPDRTADDLNMVEGHCIYLLPEKGLTDQHEAEALIRRYSKWIFEFELRGWTGNKSLWPKRRDFDLFREWFDAAISMIWDLDRGEIITYGDE